MTLAIDMPGIDLLYGKEGPSERQKVFRDNPKRYRLYGGAVGGGKSWSLSAEALRLSLNYDGNRGFMCRHESTAFRNTTLTTLLKLIHEVEQLTGSKIMSNHHKTERKIYFLNGSVILYGSLGDRDDLERIKSLEIGWFAIDEASETPFENFHMLKSRLRWKLPDGTTPYYTGILASNPEAGWVKDVFVTPQQQDNPAHDCSFIAALPSDNPFLPEGYVDELRKSNPETWVRRYLDGSWESLEGQIWPEFDFQTHVMEPFNIPEGWKRIRAIDHGQVHPTCCLWGAIDPDGNIFIYREYYSPGVVSNHCSEIRSMSEDEYYSATYMDPSCWGKTREKEGTIFSVRDEYHDYGIYPIKANNSVQAGLNRVGEFLKVQSDRPHPVRVGVIGSPSLFIFKNCRNLIKEIPDYIWKVSKSEETGKEAPKKIKDDACDTLRYLIMSRPSPANEKRKRAPVGSFNHERGERTRRRKIANMLRFR